MDGPQTEEPIIISMGHVDNRSLKDKRQQEKMTNRVSNFIEQQWRTKDVVWPNKFDEERTKQVPQTRQITMEDAKVILNGLGLTLTADNDYLIAYHLLSIIENYKSIPIDKQLSEKDQEKNIYARASTAAEYFRALGANENDLIEIINTLLTKLNTS